MTMSDWGKWLVFVGLGILAMGILCIFANKVGISFGKLPGDIHVEKEKFTLHFPLATCILISIFLTLLLNLITSSWSK
jgi:hypothetical protein